MWSPATVAWANIGCSGSSGALTLDQPDMWPPRLETDLALLASGAIALLDHARQGGRAGAVGAGPVARADPLHELAHDRLVAQSGRGGQPRLGGHAGVVGEDAQRAAR